MNKSQLAAEIGISLTALRKHLARKDAPKPDRRGCYAVKEVRAYVESRQALSKGTVSPEMEPLKVENLQLRNAQLRRDLDEMGERVSLDGLKDWVMRFLWQLKISLPSQFRPDLVTQILHVRGVAAEPVDVLRVCETWGRTVRNYLLEWSASHGVEVTQAGKPLTVSLGPILQSTFSEVRDVGALLSKPELIERSEVMRLFSEYVSALRAAGVDDDVLARAAEIAKQREEGNDK